MTEHDCVDHLVARQYQWVEPHGERCWQEWWECEVCGELFTTLDLIEMTNEEKP